MQRASGKWTAVLALAAALCLPAAAWGEGFSQEFGLRLAFGKNDSTSTVRLYSLLPRWGISLVRPGHQLGPVGVSFVLEGILSLAEAEGNGAEFGFTPLIKVSARLSNNITLFAEGGAGIISESFDSPAIPHAFNFTPQIGAGIDLHLQPRLAMTVAYRFRHSSNAGIYKENPAFNVHFVQAGLTYYY